MNASPFRINGAIKFTGFRGLDRLLEKSAEKICGLSKLDDYYQRFPTNLDPTSFLDRVFRTFNIDIRINDNALANIPAHGPTILVANHPFGAIEGLILMRLLRQYRPDVKFMANFLLMRIQELQDFFIPLDPFGGDGSQKRNLAPLKQSIHWVKNGGLLVVFPGGEVSSWQFKTRSIADPAWSSSIARLVQKTNASVVPAYFHGANGAFFHSLGLVHPLLRTLWLPRALLAKRNKTIRLEIGKSIAPKQYTGLNSNELLRYLRMRTYLLKDVASTTVGTEHTHTHHAAVSTRFSAVVEPVLKNKLIQEVQRLPANNQLAVSGGLSVYFAEARQIPNTLTEIGRLREVTFRAQGEGTGKSIDLDHFDGYYYHIFLWDNTNQELVGAYRVGLVNKIVQSHGIKGLYTHSLFKYNREFIRQLDSSMELGRSFIRQEYQKGFSPLLLLWKGIALFVSRNTDYHTLFGPVSISNDYHSLSQQLLIKFLKENRYEQRLAKNIRARKPFKQKGRLRYLDVSSIKHLDNVSEIISLIEGKKVGVPILIRQYLKLGGTMLGFNVDKQFNDSIDCLIKVDLRQTDPSVMEKYMGREALNSFLEYHRERRAS